MKKHALWAFVRKGSYPHVSLVAAGCAQAIRLVGGMAAFDRRKIEDFKFKAIARGIDKINQSSRCNFKAAFIGSSTRSRLLLPCQSVSLQNKVPRLFLNIDLTKFSMMLQVFTQVLEAFTERGWMWRFTFLKIRPPCFMRNPSHRTRSPKDEAPAALPSLAITRTMQAMNSE